MIKKSLFIFFIFQLSVAYAHVTLVYPSGGETFSVNSNIIIHWQEAINHGPSNWDLYFSADNGSHWQEIATNLSQSVKNYNWQVPDQLTEQAKIRVVQDNDAGSDYDSASGAFTITGSTGLNESENPQQKYFVLYPAFPNPFNGNTTISFSLSDNSRVQVNIYNILGKKINNLLDDRLSAGLHNLHWQPQDLPSGIYYYSILSGMSSQTGRLIYIK
jgi:Secretion system C-terminal sorting domain